MEFRTQEARAHYAALAAVAREAVVGLDFDGTLAPIVADPDRADIHPDGVATLVDLASHVRAVAVVTGRPARQVVRLGRFEEVARQLPAGARLLVRGQYGHERWDSDTGIFTSPEEPAGLAAFRRELPGLLRGLGVEDAFVEEKGLAVAVHTRRMPDPAAAFARMETGLEDAAERHGLAVEPGKLVVEIRTPGTHKGHALREVVAEVDAGGVLFAGDDLGDLEAFEAGRDLRSQGLPVLLVCSGSVEQTALTDVADVVVDGPEGVLALLRQLVVDGGRGR